MVQLSLQRALKQQSILIYLYLDSMAMEDTRPECYWHVIKVAPCFQNEIHQMPLLLITFGENIGGL